MHGGKVTAESPGLGQGSEFIVQLPVVAVQPPKPSANQRPASSSLPKRRILVVDDNRDAADTLSMILKMLGNEVRTAYDGESALTAADAFNPSLLLLDIGLPKMNGYEVARHLRGKYGKNIFLAALTGWGQEDDRIRSKEAGFDHHLVKPVDAATLRNLLAALPAPL